MTTIISRLYADTDTANAVASAMRDAGMSKRDVDVIGAGADADRIHAARVNKDDAATYAGALDGDKALVVARAPIFPFGTALKAMEIADEHDPIDAGVGNANEYIREEPKIEYSLSILKDHPKFLSPSMNIGTRKRERFASALLGLRMLSPHREKRSAISGGKLMTPMKPLTAHRTKNSAIAGGGTIFSNLFSMPTLTSRG